jgi:hypothetical protein
MKPDLATVATSVLASLVLLVVYDLYVAQPRFRAGVPTAIVAPAEPPSVLARVADAVDERLDGEALVAAGEEGTDLAEALSRASMHKVAIAEYYLSMGKWPDGPEAAGLLPAEQYGGRGVHGIRVEPDGVIVIALDPDARDAVILRGSAEANGSIYWRCEARGAAAEMLLPGSCR